MLIDNKLAQLQSIVSQHVHCIREKDKLFFTCFKYILLYTNSFAFNGLLSVNIVFYLFYAKL